MNKERRKQLREWKKRVDELKDELENILWDEQYYFDNIPENLQSSLRAQDSEEAIDLMEEAIDNIKDAIEQIDNVV